MTPCETCRRPQLGDLLTRAELAARWRVTESAIRKKQESREIGWIKVGRDPLFEIEEVERYERAHAIEAVPAGIAPSGVASMRARR
jgi:hypothetical protein